MDYTPSDREYIAGHRFMYGEVGEHIATAAILFRDRLMRPGFVLPVVRLAPVAPYGHCMALSGNSSGLSYVKDLRPGVWLYLHGRYWDKGRFHDKVDEVTLHELLHNELKQFSEDAAHDGKPWAQRCQELSTRLGLDVRIEHVRNIRPEREPGQTRKGNPKAGCPPGCLTYKELVRWPAELLHGGPSLRDRLNAERAIVVNSCGLQATEPVTAESEPTDDGDTIAREDDARKCALDLAIAQIERAFGPGGQFARKPEPPRDPATLADELREAEKRLKGQEARLRRWLERLGIEETDGSVDYSRDKGLHRAKWDRDMAWGEVHRLREHLAGSANGDGQAGA